MPEIIDVEKFTGHNFFLSFVLCWLPSRENIAVLHHTVRRAGVAPCTEVAYETRTSYGMDGRTDVRMDGRTDGRTEELMDGWTDGRRDRRMVRRMDGRTDRWIDGRTDNTRVSISDFGAWCCTGAWCDAEPLCFPYCADRPSVAHPYPKTQDVREIKLTPLKMNIPQIYLFYYIMFYVYVY